MKNTYSTIYTLNVIFQAVFTLVWDILLAFAIGYALVEWAHLPEWVYVPLVVIGAILGFISMLKFIISAMNSLDRIESERRAKYKAQRKKQKPECSENGETNAQEGNTHEFNK